MTTLRAPARGRTGPLRHSILAARSLLRRLSAAGALLAALFAGLPAQAHDVLPPGIAWIDGDVERALHQAGAQSRPLFLYWGAVWCPPCNQLKALVFRDPAFQQRMHDFVPVYLDGDGDAAQRWGERFQVVGYPTLLVLAPDGSERARLLGETDLPRMLQVLDLVREGATPAAALVRRFEAGGTLSDTEWQLLAAHAWELEPQARSAALLATLSRLAKAAPPGIPGLRARLWLHALANVQADSGPWDSAGAADALRALFTDPALVHANRDLLEMPPHLALDSLDPLADEDRASLARDWGDTLLRLSDNAGLSCTERLSYLAAWFDLPGKRERTPDPDLLVHVCDVATTDEIERQSVISGASDLLQAAGRFDEAAQLLEAEIPRAHVPAYFMLERAALARRQDRGEEAIQWSGLGYASASGGATRLQWGLAHLRDLVSFAPGRDALISELGAVLLRDAGDLPDAFADRNRRSLGRLRKLLDDWSATPRVPVQVRERLASAWSRLCGGAQAQSAGPSEACPARPGS